MTTPCKCQECSKPFQSSKRHAAFCSTACRMAWNNRRAQRGSELYDLVMCMRYERGLAKALGLWSIVCHLCQLWKAEDDKEGHKSYGNPQAILDRKPYLKAHETNWR